MREQGEQKWKGIYGGGQRQSDKGLPLGVLMTTKGCGRDKRRTYWAVASLNVTVGWNAMVEAEYR